MGYDSWKRRILGGAAFVALATGVVLGADPVQQAKLTASDAAVNDDLGSGVAASGDTALVGAYGKNASQGAAYVYRRTGTDWMQEAKLTASDAADRDDFGDAVAIDGDTAVLGAWGKNTGRGAAYVFTRTGTTWTQQAILTAFDGIDYGYFGYSVAISGNTAVIGGYGNDSYYRGVAYVFKRTGAAWALEARLTPGDPVDNSYFGYAVAVEGDTALIGARYKDNYQGAAYVFTRTGATWTQQAKLTATAPVPNDNLGYSVDLAGDTAVVGARGRTLGAGAAFVFTRSGTTWTQQAELAAADAEEGDYLGASVAIEGNAVLVGASYENSEQGSAYLFTRSGTTWSETAKLAAADGAAFENFGAAVALADGTAIAGAPFHNASRGAAYVFTGFSGGAPAATGSCVPDAVKLKVNAARPEKSTLVASGTLDTGAGAPNFAGAATFDVGGFHLDIPAFVPRGKTLTYSAGGISLVLTPSKSGSSLALFSAKVVGDPSGKVNLAGPLALRFANAVHDASGSAVLTGGTLRTGGVAAPALWTQSASAVIKGGGMDSFKLTLGFVGDGVVPAAGEDFSIGFGVTYESSQFHGVALTRKGNTWGFTAKAPGITKATVDYAKRTITIAGSGLDLGAFADGGNDVTVTVTRGGVATSCGIRMVRAGSKLTY
ncbi:MAG: FG-GAP repeat protein [Planctomycetes bacterium]|nr:FG-GAP repeat protein [Planctomycetota bacterium]